MKIFIMVIHYLHLISMVEIFIENIIASATVSGSLDLEQIINTLPNCEYKPDQFPGVVFRPGDPHVVILLFNNGKMMVTAAKSVEDVQKGMEMVEGELEKAGLLTPIDEVKSKDKARGTGTEPSESKEDVQTEPGENTGEDTGEDTGEEPSEEVADEPTEDTGEEPSEEVADEPAEDTGEEPGEEPSEDTGDETDDEDESGKDKDETKDAKKSK